MSSWKNALKSHRKIHKERSQPGARKRFGLLQKHKDYVLRARNYHKKQDLLKILREKAQNRNPDEFYFRMISQKTTDGKHVVDADEKWSLEELKLIRSQDLRYIHFKRASERKKIERMRAEVQLINKSKDTRENKHIIFTEDVNGELIVDNSKSRQSVVENSESKESHAPITQQQDASDSEDEDSRSVSSEIPRESTVSKELRQRMARERSLNTIARKMEVDQFMSKEKPVFTTKTQQGRVIHKWRKERKK